MAIRIIVDGYNFIGRHSGLSGNVEAKRERLIGWLARYSHAKGFPVSVVFDGWQSGWTEEHGMIQDGIEVIFSRRGQKADEVVVRMAREWGSAALVVSSDREVAQNATSAGGVAVSIAEFGQRLRKVLNQDLGSWEELEPKELGPADQTKKKGNPRKLSKQERKRRQRLKRL